MFLIYLLPHQNITIPSDAQILFDDLCMRPFRNMLFNAWSVLRKESTQFTQNVTPFLKLLKEFCFLKGASVISFNFSPYYRSGA